jgi:hypothetical protein
VSIFSLKCLISARQPGRQLEGGINKVVVLMIVYMSIRRAIMAYNLSILSIPTQLQKALSLEGGVDLRMKFETSDWFPEVAVCTAPLKRAFT